MYKSYLVVLWLFLSCMGASVVRAQLSVGVSAGYNSNYLQTATGYRDFTDYRPVSGFKVSVPIRYQFTNWLALQAEPGYIQKGYKQERSGFYQGMYQTNKNNYVQLPLMAHFMFGGQRLKGFVNAGVYGSYWAAGKVAGAALNLINPVEYNEGLAFPILTNISQIYPLQAYNDSYQFDTRRDRLWQAGWLAGAGISYAIGHTFEVFAEGRYEQDITDMQHSYMIDQTSRYNQTFTASFGLLKTLHAKKSNAR